VDIYAKLLRMLLTTCLIVFAIVVWILFKAVRVAAIREAVRDITNN
jgi:hypothetical protein